ncbi:glycosyltransferase [uncultured Rhodoblastus sp.]|uniref:glycosyltransferase n=1 Tax=uncultured Rhodoblastus sp. TaxID=543037 RepID=UPI0025DF6BBD|nr:glycosyltransferase [uncultured Rhodoblastus sp.]
MKVSVVICTLNRADDLQRTLESFALQRYRDFEIVVVNGPSLDRTSEVIDAWKGHIKAAWCPKSNLSMSRNIGIAAAAGDIVAFIDDDAIPEPIWLENIVKGYTAADVGGVGGWVHDATGHAYQTRYIVSNRFAASRIDLTMNPTPYNNCPGAVEYCSLLGTNSSFRRDLLVEMGGFDEEFAYYLDETDVCLRVVDRGYRIIFVEDARVLHKFASSHMRNTRKVLHNRYQIIKNQCYFSFLHGAPAEGYAKALAETQKFVTWHRDDVEWCIGAGLLKAETRQSFEEEAEQGIRDGLTRALSGKPSHRPAAFFAEPAPFLPFPIEGVKGDALTIVLLSQVYPPGYVDGVGRFTAELASGLAQLGHEVHVVTSGADENRVDLEEGVWVHRIVPLGHDGRDADIPGEIWSKAAAAAAEVGLIQETASVDVIQAPGWDAEGIALLRHLATEAAIVTSLHTPMLVAAVNHPNWLVDHERMASVILPIMRLERELFLFSDAIYANSLDVVSTIQSHYNITFDTLGVVPHGLRDRLSNAGGGGKPVFRAEAPGDRLRILFVGRLETRKGIDVVLAAMPRIFASLPETEFWFVGQDHTETIDGESTIDGFRRKNAAQPWLDRVNFFGRTEKEFLDEFYSQCDLVVMPSRYESFGLVLLEAMMHGLPVIAARAGGMKEVVADGETGLLTPPGDADAFADAVITLGSDAQWRRRLGANGRARYEEKFTAAIMAEQSVALYRRILAAKQHGRLQDKRTPTPNGFPLSRPWELADFWFRSPLRSWARDEWFFPAAPIWIGLLAREALFRNGVEGERRVLAIGSSEPFDLVASLFPGAVHVARADLPNRGGWADSSIPKRALDMIGLRDEDFDLVIVFKPLPDHEYLQSAALAELARLVRPTGVLACLVNGVPAQARIRFLAKRGFVVKELERDAPANEIPAASLHSIVATRAVSPSQRFGPPRVDPGAALSSAAAQKWG